jgi:hypothetical protein
MDAEAARRLSDEFMADVVSQHADLAFDKMEPEFKREVSRGDFASAFDELSQYCGWPLDSELKNIQAGSKTYKDGHTNATMRFMYATNTNRAPKGGCFFSIEVAQAVGP